MANLSRRNVIQYGSAVLAGNIITVPRTNASNFVYIDEGGKSYLDEDIIKRLSRTAVDAAISAGASYADVRLTYAKTMENIGADLWSPERSEIVGIGIRSLASGYWGFAASPIWNESEAARLGKSATANALANNSKSAIPIELAELRNTDSGSWIMPVEIDPFDIPYEEITDYLSGLRTFIARLEKVDPRTPNISASSLVQDKYFFSSENQYTHQRLYNTSAGISFMVSDQLGRAPSHIDFLTPAGMGIELVKNRFIRDRIVEYYEIALQERGFAAMPVDVGRYQVLMDRGIMAHLASQSIGMSTELDRALGYESNSGGSSFINAPEEMMGTLALASPMINITASRSEKGSVGKVEWDDEGVKPTAVQVIKDGKLAALQAPREGYSWLKKYHEANNTKFVANGSVNSESGMESPLVFSSDLIIEGDDKKSQSLDELREGIKDGIEFKSGSISMDFQLSTGIGLGGIVFKIKNGKRVARIMNAGTIFRTANLWKNIIEVGRSQDTLRFGISLSKGEPRQTCYHSVYAPHMVVKDMDIIDVTRKA